MLRVEGGVDLVEEVEGSRVALRMSLLLFISAQYYFDWVREAGINIIVKHCHFLLT